MIFRKTALIPASVKRVYAFHCNPQNLEHVQPPAAKVLSAELPEELSEGAMCSVTVQVMGIAQRWTIQVEQLVPPQTGGQGWMLDRALESPFSFWLHRHVFEDLGSETRMTDVVDFEPPGGILKPLLALPAWIALWMLFSIRHIKTRSFFKN